MIISSYSALMALFWFVIFLTVGDFLRRRTGLLSHYNFYVLLIFIGLSVVRLILPVELSFTKVIRSEVILTTANSIFSTPFINVGIVHISLINMLILIWCVGGIYNIIRLCLRLKHDWEVLQTISPVSDEASSQYLSEIALKTAPRKKYRLLVTPDINTPMVIGIFTPTILLPQTDLDAEYLRLQLAHEWQHVLNKDQIVKLLINLISCVMWWIPAARHLKDSIEDALEIRCDLKLTQKMNDAEKSKYLKALILGYDRAFQEGEAKSFFSLSSRLTSSKSADEAVKERLGIISKHKSGFQGMVLVFSVIACVVFALSFLYVFQPYYPAPEYKSEVDSKDVFSPENAYLVAQSDGTYSLYVDDEYWRDYSKEEIKYPPLSTLSIKNDE